jgi:hypothetical protein
MKRMQRIASVSGLFVGVILLGTVTRPVPAQDAGEQNDDNDSRIQKGFAIAPVHLNLEGKNRALVGLGSYIVNAQAVCNACHTCPSFTPGHSPFNGVPEQINGDGYLAGGVPFAPTPFISRNITPDASGHPAGLTFDQFRHLIRTGEDPDHFTPLLQIMPWPTFRKMNDHDLRAIYEYLSAIPSNPRKDGVPGPCHGPDLDF